VPVALQEPKPPRYVVKSIYGVIPVDPRKPFDHPYRGHDDQGGFRFDRSLEGTLYTVS
jgi:hypothetical protein